jgi:membrane protease subunit (stomatin/prohibitin family)
MALTYRELLRQVRALARDVRRATDAHKKTATAMTEEAKDTGRIAEQIAALKVDTATVAETREVARIMQGLSQSALAYANAADEAWHAAVAAEQQALTDHGGIQQAADSSTVPMADRQWYTQE